MYIKYMYVVLIPQTHEVYMYTCTSAKSIVLIHYKYMYIIMHVHLSTCTCNGMVCFFNEKSLGSHIRV